jgi:hypothetical protein
MKKLISINRSPALREVVVHPRNPLGYARRPPPGKTWADCDNVCYQHGMRPPSESADDAPADAVGPTRSTGQGRCCLDKDTLSDLAAQRLRQEGFCACVGRPDADDATGDALADVPVQVVEAPQEAAAVATDAAPPLAGADVVPPPSSSPAPADAGAADGAAQ